MTVDINAIKIANEVIGSKLAYVISCLGLFGNLINLIVFTQLKFFRRTQSVFYLNTMLITECLLLIFSVSNRIPISLYDWDPTSVSVAWCKIQNYIVQTQSVILMNTICFAAIDQYLSTSHINHIRIISTIKLAYRLVGCIVIISILYNIIFLIFFEIHPSLGCTSLNASFTYYYAFVHLCIILGVIPIVISLVFSLLAYQNVRRIVRRQIAIVRRRLDQQLTAMVLVRVALFIITTLPLITTRSYQLNTTRTLTDPEQNAVYQLTRSTVTTFYYLNYSVRKIRVWSFLYFCFYFAREVFMYSLQHRVDFVDKFDLYSVKNYGRNSKTIYQRY